MRLFALAFAAALSGCAAQPIPVDTDGDNVPDAEDAFPGNPFESRDADGDGVGDRADRSNDERKGGAEAGRGKDRGGEPDAAGNSSRDEPRTAAEE